MAWSPHHLQTHFYLCAYPDSWVSHFPTEPRDTVRADILSTLRWILDVCLSMSWAVLVKIEEPRSILHLMLLVQLKRVEFHLQGKAWYSSSHEAGSVAQPRPQVQIPHVSNFSYHWEQITDVFISLWKHLTKATFKGKLSCSSQFESQSTKVAEAGERGVGYIVSPVKKHSKINVGTHLDFSFLLSPKPKFWNDTMHTYVGSSYFEEPNLKTSL